MNRPPRRYFAFVNGILTLPGKSSNWTKRATTWIHNHSLIAQNAGPTVAECIEYFTFPLTRWLFHKKWVTKFKRNLEYHPTWDTKIVVTHSNGANIALDALMGMAKAGRMPVIEHLHLISGACERDISYLDPYLGKEIKHLTIWIAGRDRALLLATLGGWLGYGTLGRGGPVGLSAEAMNEHVTLHCEPGFDHSSWFNRDNFQATMEKIYES